MMRPTLDLLCMQTAQAAQTARPQRRRMPASRKSANRFGTRVDVPVNEHGIDPSLLDAHATEVVETLQQAGYEAYIVGGAVRDLLLGLRPKDFDVATNATPEQVKALFRRAFIIGRRFRLVHVVFGRGQDHEVIEVSTFRAFLDSADADHVSGNERTAKRDLANSKHAVDASGRVLRDNVWGPQDEDAARRDFTINAMYYDPNSQVLVDYHGGMEDMRAGVLRMIGDPQQRYREDPVRIVRAVRFLAKLSARGFAMDSATAAPMGKMKALLLDVPQSRMFDEMLKLLQTGHGLASVQQLRELGLAKGIYPLLDLVVARAESPMIQLALADTDRRVAEGKGVSPSFLLACVLWEDVLRASDSHVHRGASHNEALQMAVDDVFANRIGDVSGRGRLAADMREVWMMQLRFVRRVAKVALGLVNQPRFRAGFDFFRLRSRAGEIDAELVEWWQTFSLASDTDRQAMLQALKPARPARASGKVHQKREAATEVLPDEVKDDEGREAGGEAQALGTETDGPAKKRRRRRKRSNAISADVSPEMAAEIEEGND